MTTVTRPTDTKETWACDNCDAVYHSPIEGLVNVTHRCGSNQWGKWKPFKLVWSAKDSKEKP